MQEYLNRIRNQITEYWTNLSNRSRMQLISAVVVGVVALVVTSIILSRPTLTPIKENISVEEVTSIETELTSQGIAYSFSPDNSILSVDDNKVREAEVALAGIGIISDTGFTYEDAFNNSLTATQGERDAKLQLAYESELNRKLEAFDQIKTAYIKLYIGDEGSVIFDEVRPSSASLTLELIDNLSKDTVIGIVSMIKNSVPNLSEENISIMSTSGEVLYNGAEANGIGGAISNQTEYDEAVQRTYRNGLTPQLLAIGTYDDVTINMNLDIDFNEVSSISEDYEAGPVIREFTSETTSTNQDNGGAPGSDTNGSDTTSYDTESGTSSSSAGTQSDVTYQADKTVISTVQPPGGVNLEGSSMAVMINKITYVREEDVEARGDLAEISWEEYQEQNGDSTQLEVPEDIIDLIKTGSGIENVSVLSYNRPMFLDKEASSIEVISYLPIAIIIILIGVVVYMVIRGTEPIEVEETEPELSVEEMLESTKETQDFEEIDFNDKSDIRKQLEHFVDKNPDAVAALLRNWINEEWE